MTTSGPIQPEDIQPVEAGDAITAEAAATDPEELLQQFRIAASNPDGNWHMALIETIALWPLASEEIDGRNFVYLLAGEAFDWRTLAERILCAPDLPVSEEEREELLLDSALPAGLKEEEFRRLIGFAKGAGFLNYFYGVTVEQAIQLAVEEQVRKRRYARGFAPDDFAADVSYEVLYGATRDDLITEFTGETGTRVSRQSRGPERAAGNLGNVDQFTYWLFQRRFKNADPARIASDTRKGLELLERMRLAEARKNSDEDDSTPYIDLDTLHTYKAPPRYARRIRRRVVRTRG
ncbi:MAG: hypothetical protein HOC77_10670 [Chloroflexi bacterium]|jgi:hypothetical protein|nr:hypothetical protein [Chloroflexota bacterium]MBT4073923.1 hypothetical protein [Chloroflexota bacterium]MBT4515540.1 hypothetical protein [Chloroflexota bacterium]MBT6681270.1 hypothetical protein [Chloroflexota bacterium]